MAVRFVLGRAGTGKTVHCLQAIAAALKDRPLGPPLIWLVPEQSTFNVERMLATHPELRGSFRAQVLSFRRWAQLNGQRLGVAPAAELDDLARTLLLADLVMQVKPRLTLFGPAAQRPGFIQRLDAMLRELQQAAHTGNSLRGVAQELSGGAGGAMRDLVLLRKLHDLALLLDGWDTLLRERQLSSERLQDAVAARLHELPELKEARLWVDGFSGFNQLEVRTLLAAARHCADVEITLTLDPQEGSMRDPAKPLDELSLFHRTQRAYRMLTDAMREEGIEVAPAVLCARRHRFEGAADLDRVESGLFAPRIAAHSDEAAPANIQLWQCASPLTEVRAAAQHIRRLVSDATRPLRYRDIALIIPDLEGYADAVRRVFSAHTIPHFIDLRRSIAHHPLVEFLRCAVQLPLNGYAADDLAILLKTGLTPVDEPGAWLVENYMLAHGMARVDLARPFGFMPANEEGDDGPIVALPTAAQERDLDTINAARRTLLKVLRRWLLLADGTEAVAGEAFAAGLKLLLEDVDAAGRMNALLAQANAAGDVELEMIHGQAQGQIQVLLDALERLLKGRTTTLREFAEMLGAALESLTLGLIPPTLDQVLVSSVARSRHPEIKVAIILGALETRFPIVRPEDPLLNDPQREAFNERTPQPIMPGADRQLLEARFFDYVAFTRASGQLIVSCPVADAQGRAVTASPYVARLRQLFPMLVPQVIAEDSLNALERICTLDDALIAGLLWGRRQENAASLRARLPEMSVPEASAAPDADLFAWLSTTDDSMVRGRADAALRSLRMPAMPTLIPALAAAFYPSPIRMSISHLEHYAGCPLQYFLMYTLGLKQRPRLQLDAMNMGTLFHAVLEKFFGEVVAHKIPWPACTPQQMTATLRRAADAAVRELHQELASTLPQYPRILARVVRTLGMTLEAQRRAAAAGAMRPAATELTFGMSGAERTIALPVFSLKTPGGRVADLSGKIDRVDLAANGDAIVIDYKSSADKRLDLHLLLHGIQLQLPVYMLAIAERGAALREGGVTPIGGLFVPLARPRKMCKDPGTANDPGADAFYQSNVPRGMVKVDAVGELESAIDGGKAFSSAWYKIKRTEKGEMAKSGNDGFESADFELVLRFTRHRAVAIVDAMAEGRIAPLPYRDSGRVPCAYCDVKDMCGFDRIRGVYQELKKGNREEILEAMRSELERAEEHDGSN